MNLQEEVLHRIQNEFGDEVILDFHDESGDGKHFYLDITSAKFIGKSRIEQSKLVYQCLDDLMKTGAIHALRMKCSIPG